MVLGFGSIDESPSSHAIVGHLECHDFGYGFTLSYRDGSI